MAPLPPCVKCKNHEPGQTDEVTYGETPGKDQQSLLLSGVHLTTGVLAWICHDCFVQWVRVSADNPLRQARNRLQLRLDFTMDLLARNPRYARDALVAELLPLMEIWDELAQLEPRLDELARDFLGIE